MQARHRIKETLRKIVSIVVWIWLGAGCSPGSTVGPAIVDRTPRLEAIKRGLALRSDNPDAAARALSSAGIGSELEQMRFRVWLQALERGQSATEAWEDFLDQAPPTDLADRARLALAQSFIDDGQPESAWQILADVSEEGQVRADVLRLGGPDDMRHAAAVRLAVVAPSVLRQKAAAIEKSAVAALRPEQAIERGVAWRDDGHPRTGASELRAIRVQGPLEERRRLELARCELRRGSASAALRILPALSRCNGDEALVRASSWRKRGWSRYPKPAATEAFKNCLAASQRARSLNTGSRSEALELQLECGTESGALQSALTAWEALAEMGWQGSRRSWLGRRLGVALARSGRSQAEAEILASSLKDDARCLQFAVATAPPKTNRQTVTALAQLAIPDLYALWSLEAIGISGPKVLHLPKDIVVSDPPPTVQWLIDLGEMGFASTEWRRLAAAGGVLPGEALAAADFEQDRGRPDLAIRWLRRGIADLGGPAMHRVSENVVKAYLPLRWIKELKLAADEFGLEPWLLAGLARQESIFNERARSPAGARGIVQLMPGTARSHAVALGLGRSPDLFDPGVNLRLGARELSRLMSNFGEVEPALAAYNAGESRVRAWWRLRPDRYLFTEAVPIPETYTYIRRVRFLSEAYRLVWADEWKEPTPGK